MRIPGLAIVSLTSFLGCATESLDEDYELGDTIVDGATDSWGQPTSFGTLFEDTWQYGEIDPASSVRHPAWTFSLDDTAAIKIITRKAPVAPEDVTLKRAVVYLYKQETAGTWTRIAKSMNTTGFGALARNLGAGDYRVLIKGIAASDDGELMLRLACTGAGCAEGPQCLLGDDYAQVNDVKRGAVEFSYRSVLTATSSINVSNQPQIIAAVNESSHTVSTIAEAFDAVDGGEINRDVLLDNLSGRVLKAFEYGAGENSYGAIFQGNDPTPVATIHDGGIESCTVFAQTCVFGRDSGEADHMPDLQVTGEHTFHEPSEVPSSLRASIIAAVAYDGNVPTLAQAFETVDENVVYVSTYRHSDGRDFIAVRYHSGDTPVGAFFKKGSTQKVGEISDGEINDCSAM